jgi:hypothetical protein
MADDKSCNRQGGMWKKRKEIHYASTPRGAVRSDEVRALLTPSSNARARDAAQGVAAATGESTTD